MPDQDESGQVSEVSNLEDAGGPIMPDQAVAGAPDAESGTVQEGKTGPNALTGQEGPPAEEHSGDHAATHD